MLRLSRGTPPAVSKRFNSLLTRVTPPIGGARNRHGFFSQARDDPRNHLLCSLTNDIIRVGLEIRFSQPPTHDILLSAATISAMGNRRELDRYFWLLWRMEANIELTVNGAEFRLKNCAETRVHSQSPATRAIAAKRMPRLAPTKTPPMNHKAPVPASAYCATILVPRWILWINF